MRKEIMALSAVFVLLMIPSAMAGSVDRELSVLTAEPGDTITVTLNVVVDGEKEYAFEEAIPPGMSLVSADESMSHVSGMLKLIVCGECEIYDDKGTPDANDDECWIGSDNPGVLPAGCALPTVGTTTYTYELEATSSGDYEWSGTFMFGDMQSEQSIGGDDQLTVSQDQEEDPPEEDPQDDTPPAQSQEDDDDDSSSGGGGGGFCNPSWECTEWGECQPDGFQERTCTDTRDCGNTHNMPELSQGCEYTEPGPACIEDWLCTEWSSCTDSEQTRTCSDQNECGTEDSKPIENQACFESSTGMVTVEPFFNLYTMLLVGVIALVAGIGFWKADLGRLTSKS